MRLFRALIALLVAMGALLAFLTPAHAQSYECGDPVYFNRSDWIPVSGVLFIEPVYTAEYWLFDADFEYIGVSGILSQPIYISLPSNTAYIFFDTFGKSGQLGLYLSQCSLVPTPTATSVATETPAPTTTAVAIDMPTAVGNATSAAASIAALLIAMAFAFIVLRAVAK